MWFRFTESWSRHPCDLGAIWIKRIFGTTMLIFFGVHFGKLHNLFYFIFSWYLLDLNFSRLIQWNLSKEDTSIRGTLFLQNFFWSNSHKIYLIGQKMSDLFLVGLNYSSNKIFVISKKFRHICPIKIMVAWKFDWRRVINMACYFEIPAIRDFVLISWFTFEQISLSNMWFSNQ